MNKKKEYEKPCITSEKAFEQNALQCTVTLNTNFADAMACCRRKAPGPAVANS